MRANRRLFLAAALASVLLAACGGGQQTAAILPTSTSGVQTPPAQVETATPAPTPNQLAYIGAGGNILLVNSDGSGARKIADTSSCGRFPHLIWSPTGDTLTCIGSGPDDEGLIVLVDAKGQELADMQLDRPVWPLYWSPGGDAFLYAAAGYVLLTGRSGEGLADFGPLDLSLTYNGVPYRGLKFWSPDGRQLVYRPADATEMRIYSLDSASERSVSGDYRPLAWVLGGKALLVATGYQPPVPGGYPTYEANLLDLASGELTRVPTLDNGRQFWVSPDGTRAAVLTQGSGGLPGLATLALPSGEFSPIPDSVITYGSDHIPEEWVTFTADGSEIYWITQWESGAAVFRANSDGTGLVKMAQFESPSAEFSPDLTMIAYQVFDDNTHTVTLYTGNIDGTGVHEIDGAATGGFAPAWRPTP